MRGTTESTVKSMGSKLKHHNMEGRRITTEHLSGEVFVAGNGPEIQHCDNVFRSEEHEEHSTDIFGGKEWYMYFITSRVVKVHTISQAVDLIQRMPQKFSMMRD